MDIIKLLNENSEDIISESFQALQRVHLKHYEMVGNEETQKRLNELFRLMTQCVKEKNLGLIITFANKIAEERFNSGFDLHEVQTGFNVLEETIWKLILKKMSPHDFALSIGLISTVLGAGKDALARKYVSMASKGKSTSLNLKAIFEGTSS